MTCGLYTPGIEYVEPARLSGVTLDQISATRWGAKVGEGGPIVDVTGGGGGDQ